MLFLDRGTQFLDSMICPELIERTEQAMELPVTGFLFGKEQLENAWLPLTKQLAKMMLRMLHSKSAQAPQGKSFVPRVDCSETGTKSEMTSRNHGLLAFMATVPKKQTSFLRNPPYLLSSGSPTL